MFVKNRKSFLFFVISLVFMLVLAACGGSSSPSTSQTNDQQTQPQGQTGGQSQGSDSQDKKEEPAREPLVLKSSIQSPPAAALSKGFDAFLDEVEEKSGGLIKFERFYSESLAKAADQLNAVSSGIADIAMFVPTYTPGKIPLATVSSNPALWADSYVGAKAYNALYHEVPEMQQEMEANNAIFVSQYATPSYYVISSKEVRSIDDLKGLKVIATGQLGVLAKELGASPAGIPITDSFEALQRGTIDGVFYGITASATYGLEQYAKYIYKLPVGGGAGVIAFNLDTWKKIPEDIQQIIMDIGTNSHPESFHTVYQIEGDEAALQKFIDAGVEIIEPSTDDLATLDEVARNAIWSKWIQDNSAKGPSQAVFDAFYENVKKFEQENPFK